MDRPVRRSRQRIPESGLIGLLPQEEAAINRALHESLLQEKKKTPPKQHTEPPTSTHTPHTSAPPNKPGHAHASTADSNTRNRTGGSSSGTKARRRLHSPLSPSQSLDSSSESKSSSPSRGSGGGGATLRRGTSSSLMSSPRSVESSLKLTLSTSSWSRSSSSSWSPTPEPTGSSNVGKVTQKSTPVQPKVLSKLKIVKNTSTKVKGKRGRPRKYPPKEKSSKCSPKCGAIKRYTTAAKVGKMPKTYTKAALQLHGALLSKKKKQVKAKTNLSTKCKEKRGCARVAEQSNELDVPPLSPEAALVLHDHCYMGGVSHESSNMKGGSATSTDVKCNIRCSPYAAQRKFPQNQVPTCTPTRPPVDEVENVSGPKEVPKTEDFITFLCLRGSDSIPKDLEKFAFPWTQFQQKNGHEVSKRKTLSFTATKGVTKSKSRNVAKKLGYSASNSIPALSSH